MKEKCDIYDCDRPCAPDQPPRPTAHWCAEHEAEFDVAFKARDVAAIVRLGVKSLPDHPKKVKLGKYDDR